MRSTEPSSQSGWDTRGDAPNKLLPLVYQELRTCAQAYLQRERSDHTLQLIALVHEAHVRLVGMISATTSKAKE